MLALTTWIVRRTLHPLRRMADAMDELSRGQGDHPPPAGQRP